MGKDTQHTGKCWHHDLRWVRWIPFSRWGNVVLLPGVDVSVTARGQWAAQCDWLALICRGNCELQWTDAHYALDCIVVCAGPSEALNVGTVGGAVIAGAAIKDKARLLFTLLQNASLFPTPSSIVCCPRINYPLLHCNWDMETIRKPLPKPGPWA